MLNFEQVIITCSNSNFEEVTSVNILRILIKIILGSYIMDSIFMSADEKKQLL